jgi:hypothetical protein
MEAPETRLIPGQTLLLDVLETVGMVLLESTGDGKLHKVSHGVPMRQFGSVAPVK